MKKLTLVEYGCAGTGYRNGSDVPNCRVRAEFDARYCGFWKLPEARRK